MTSELALEVGFTTWISPSYPDGTFEEHIHANEGLNSHYLLKSISYLHKELLPGHVSILQEHKDV